jgi:hypothetical protein
MVIAHVFAKFILQSSYDGGTVGEADEHSHLCT